VKEASSLQIWRVVGCIVFCFCFSLSLEEGGKVSLEEGGKGGELANFLSVALSKAYFVRLV
jgi:hypothetical protein